MGERSVDSIVNDLLVLADKDKKNSALLKEAAKMLSDLDMELESYTDY
jgi:hypothetical protein